jgi:LiaI-LiaF-like transmembrane region
MNPAERPWPQDAAQAPPPYPPPGAAPAPAVLIRKRPLLAAALSLFPGLGQIYDGLYLRGIILFLVFGSLIALVVANGSPFFGLSIAFTLFFSVIDAYRQALLINFGYAQDLGLTDLPLRPRASQGGLVAGVILTLLGLLALAERFFDIDLDWLADFWPLGLVALGGWLIVATLRERRKEREGV